MGNHLWEEKESILNNKAQLMEALFQQVSVKGEYPLSVLQKSLAVEPNALISAIEALCEISDLFNYDAAFQVLATRTTYIPLEMVKILKGLPIDLQDKVTICRSFITESTNSDLEKISLVNDDCDTSNLMAIAVTEMQRGGRGRRAKQWVSPLAKNLYFSFKFHFPQSALPYISTLSLRSGIALLESLQLLGIYQAKIKWPNDIWVEGQKLAGILVESSVNSRGIEVVIGMGVNNHQGQSTQIVGNRPTNCESILGKALDRHQLIALLTQKLYQICLQIVMDPQALPNLSALWEAHSCFIGKVIRLISDQGEEIGQEIGIDERGALLIQYADGSTKAHLSGDLSLRAYN